MQEKKELEEFFKRVQGKIRLAYAQEDKAKIAIDGLLEVHRELLEEAWGSQLVIEKTQCYFKGFSE